MKEAEEERWRALLLFNSFLRVGSKMVRMSLTAYLMLATLAGPALCCCTTPQLVNRLSHHRKQSESAARHPHCSHCHRHDGDKQQPKSPRQEGCPCKEQGRHSQAVAILAADSESANQLELTFPHGLPLSVDASSKAMLAILTRAQTCDSGLPSAFLTPEEMLRALHIMRC